MAPDEASSETPRSDPHGCEYWLLPSGVAGGTVGSFGIRCSLQVGFTGNPTTWRTTSGESLPQSTQRIPAPFPPHRYQMHGEANPGDSIPSNGSISHRLKPVSTEYWQARAQIRELNLGVCLSATGPHNARAGSFAVRCHCQSFPPSCWPDRWSACLFSGVGKRAGGFLASGEACCETPSVRRDCGSWLLRSTSWFSEGMADSSKERLKNRLKGRDRGE